MLEALGTVLSTTEEGSGDRGWGKRGPERMGGREGGGGEGREGVAREGSGSISFREQIRFVTAFSLTQELSFLCISKYYKILSMGGNRGMCFYKSEDFMYRKGLPSVVSNFFQIIVFITLKFLFLMIRFLF